MVAAQKAAQGPVIDGKGDDAVWVSAETTVTHDAIAGIDITLKAVYTDAELFFLVMFPDADESRLHKAWVWDDQMQLYRQGPTREDVFVIKWAMSQGAVNLSVFSDEPYTADIWFWKACRTDPAGFADDKIQLLSVVELANSRKMMSASGKTLYLQRRGDEGREAYKNILFDEYKGAQMPHFESQQPVGSRADIRAKGLWQEGVWTIEFGRVLVTGNDDDVQLDISENYHFGVSRYEIAGRGPEPEATQPLYGTGDVGEELILYFKPQTQ